MAKPDGPSSSESAPDVSDPQKPQSSPYADEDKEDGGFSTKKSKSVPRARFVCHQDRVENPFDIMYPKLPTEWKHPSSAPADEETWKMQCFLTAAELRYAKYLKWLAGPGPAKEDRSLSGCEWLPPWDARTMFYTHLLSPLQFRADIQSTYPELWRKGISFPLPRFRKSCSDFVWNRSEWQKYSTSGIPLTVDFVGRQSDIGGYHCNQSPSCKGKNQKIEIGAWTKFRTGQGDLYCPGCGKLVRIGILSAMDREFRQFVLEDFDLHVFPMWSAPLRQFGTCGFVDKILHLMTDFRPESKTHVMTVEKSKIPQAQDKYIKFIQLMEGSNTMLVPTLDVDLIWHTHQLSPASYHLFCEENAGRLIDHDDKINSVNLKNRLLNTKRAWEIAYGEGYLESDTNEISTLQMMCEELSVIHDENEKQAAEIQVQIDKMQDSSLPFREELQHMGLRDAALRARIAAIRPSLSFAGGSWFSKQKRLALQPLKAEKSNLDQRKDQLMSVMKARDREVLMEEHHRQICLRMCKESERKIEGVKKSLSVARSTTTANCAFMCGNDYQKHKDNYQTAFTPTDGLQLLSSGIWVLPPAKTQTQGAYHDSSGGWTSTADTGYSYGGYTSTGYSECYSGGDSGGGYEDGGFGEGDYGGVDEGGDEGGDGDGGCGGGD